MRFTAFIYFLLFCSPIFAWDSPWDYQSPASSPWGGDEPSPERKTVRENFFRGLNDRTPPQAEPQSTDDYSEPAEERFPTSTGPSEHTSNKQPLPKRSLNDDFEYGRVTKPEIEYAALNESPTQTLHLPWNQYQNQFPRARFVPRQLLWPVRGGRLSSGYGIRGGHFHEGLDISSPRGTPIHAASSGRVVFTGSLAGYGRLIVVYHGQGYSSVYAHLDKAVKKKGDYVRRGELIARIGNTGHSTGYHVHFEIRRDGSPINPLQFSFKGSPLLAERSTSSSRKF